MADDPKTVGGVLSASLPQALAAGMVAIGALLVSMQIQQARIEAAVQSMSAAVQELKNDARADIADLDKRVRVLEMQN